MYNIERKLRLKQRLVNLSEDTKIDPVVNSIHHQYLSHMSQGFSEYELIEGYVGEMNKFSNIYPDLNEKIKTIVEDINENYIHFIAKKSLDSLKKSNDPTVKNAVEILESKLDLSESALYKSILEDFETFDHNEIVSNMIYMAKAYKNKKPTVDNMEVSEVYSPVYVLSESELLFNLVGEDLVWDKEKNDIYKFEGDIRESKYETYNYLVDNFSKYEIGKDGSMSCWAGDTKMQVKLDETGNRKLVVNGEVLENKTDDIKRFINYTGIINNQNLDVANSFIGVYENLDSIRKIDFAKIIKNVNDNKRAVALLTLEGKQKAYFVDFDERKSWLHEELNSLEFADDIKEFINVDVTPWIEGTEEQKRKIEEKLQEKKVKINSDISFLKSKIETIKNQENYELEKNLQEAVNFLQEEVSKKEKERNEVLDELYNTVTEKFEDMGYVESKFSSRFNEYRKGDTIYVLAADYTKSGENEYVTVMDEDSREFEVPKSVIDSSTLSKR